VVLAVGTEMSETDIFWSSKLTMNGRLIRIDADPAKLADHYDATLALWGDARSTLQSINEVLNGRVAPGRAGWRTQLGGAAHCRQKADAQFDARFSAPLGALKAIRAALPPDGVVFSDMTQIAYLGNYAFPCDAPGLWFHPAGYGTLGFALPAALGAKIAAPARPIIALAGDFGLQFTLGELMTAVETGLSLPIVLWNNSALGQIRDDMLAAGIPALGVVGRNPNFLALAESYGAAARRARSAAQLTDALRTALGAPGPTLIEVVDEDF
jgi:5-guanidino-2-oxopentanoate decarboxylase